jgi:hypothetical protein
MLLILAWTAACSELVPLMKRQQDPPQQITLWTRSLVEDTWNTS